VTREAPSPALLPATAACARTVRCSEPTPGANEAELFAVATEAFFERPRELARKHPELYAMLADAYGQDPAGHAGEAENEAPETDGEARRRERNERKRKRRERERER
jgi:hypothetical protein